jgi:integration host factor subunit beta
MFPPLRLGAIGMIKSELLKRISLTSPHLHQRDLEKVVNAILDEITVAMARGDRVELRGFGTFGVKTWRARTARNPRTGALVEVRQKRFPFFRAGKEMRERVNKPTQS